MTSSHAARQEIVFVGDARQYPWQTAAFTSSKSWRYRSLIRG
jgi:hypothetical protein